MTHAIVVIGEICSGKSFLAREISTSQNIPIASFGSFLKHYCVENSFPHERADLQNLGEEFIRNKPRQFLEEVIQFSASDSPLIIIEGVRHKVIQENIEKIFTSRFVIYVTASYAVRLQRYLLRNKDSDTNKSENEFAAINEHPVEKEVKELKDRSNLIFDSGADPTDKVILALTPFIVKSKQS